MRGDSDGKGMAGGSYVPPAPNPVKDARDFLGRLFRREGYDYISTEAAVNAYAPELVALLTGESD